MECVFCGGSVSDMWGKPVACSMACMIGYIVKKETDAIWSVISQLEDRIEKLEGGEL